MHFDPRHKGIDRRRLGIEQADRRRSDQHKALCHAIGRDATLEHFEGDKNSGSQVTVMDNPMASSVQITDYSADSVDSIVVLGGPMPGTQLTHIDRKNPGASYVEVKGEIWNMMGGMMGGMMGQMM